MKTDTNDGNPAAVLACTAATLSTVADAGDEQGEQLEGSSERRVSLVRIDRTFVMNDSNILFYLRGRKVYTNKLPRKCLGLRRADSFMYKTSLSQLCSFDIVTALDNIGFGFLRGASCALGKFYLIEAERAKELRGQKAAAIGKIEPVE